ncbi:DnaD domain protein [Cohnella caldifontis]|uniref:DnaD domain protein n=1 Tax=Cohnella caldifontis TaxID=3027471 RepID=UPI0023EB6440|nr:DnaD domain protein [Cohnella sp. YIM B05605]
MRKRVVDSVMHVSNLLEFTENHRYFVYRDFALSGLDRKLLAALYQPMVGAFAAGLYHYLYHVKAEDEVGYSSLESQRELFLGLGVEPGPSGRKVAIDAASKLEAVGLLQVFVHENPLTEETVYEYALLRPLGAAEFFSNVHLSLLLRDKIGRSAVLELRKRWSAEPPAELTRFIGRQEVTVPFYDMFRLSGGPADPELEAGWQETATARQQAPKFTPPEKIRYHDILKHFPRSATTRRYVERLNKAPETMQQLNYYAYRYDLTVLDVQRLLDRDEMFRADGAVNWEIFEENATEIFKVRQSQARAERVSVHLEPSAADPEPPGDAGEGAFDVPAKFRDSVTPKQYEHILRHEPYHRVLAWHFPGEVPEPTRRLYNRIFFELKMPQPVINVLIHYVNEILNTNWEQPNSAAYVETIASTMLQKNIDTFELAVAYVKAAQRFERRRREEKRAGEGTGARSRGRAQAPRKPALSVVEDTGPIANFSAEEWERMMDLARKLQEE